MGALWRRIHPSLYGGLGHRLHVDRRLELLLAPERRGRIYGPSDNLIRSPEGSRSRYVGSGISLTADWQINRHLNLTTIYAHFFPGSFLRETGSAEPIDFVEFTLSLPF
ncbi:MAG: alginate export family protein [Gammaproteobacteria bacterium]